VTDLRVVPASSLDRATVLEAFNGGYRGYAVHTELDAATFDLMVDMVDIQLDRSLIGYVGDQLAGMAMLALRGQRSWIGGMGVLPEFRGRGFGADLMRAAIANAKSAGARVMNLEVLVDNAPARRIYEALGFRSVRGLVVWLAQPDAATPAASRSLVPIALDRALTMIASWVPEPWPWQRAPETIAHLPAPPSALGLEHEGTLVGAVIYRALPERASILALGAADGRASALQRLVDGVRALHPVPLRFLNLPEGDPAERVFEALGAQIEARQTEMTLPL
jgi:ribosomal protein S18 acetylase RimI-like enzyme